jgi:hypothetical protein
MNCLRTGGLVFRRCYQGPGELKHVGYTLELGSFNESDPTRASWKTIDRRTVPEVTAYIMDSFQDDWNMMMEGQTRVYYRLEANVYIIQARSSRARLIDLVTRSIKCQSHQNSSNETGDRDGHHPREEQEAHTLPVDSLESAVAETNTDGRTSDAHRSGHGQLVLGEDEDGDGGSHLHGRTTGRRVVGDLVAHDC